MWEPQTPGTRRACTGIALPFLLITQETIPLCLLQACVRIQYLFEWGRISATGNFFGRNLKSPLWSIYLTDYDAMVLNLVNNLCATSDWWSLR
jgi:hypothetical protein